MEHLSDFTQLMLDEPSTAFAVLVLVLVLHHIFSPVCKAIGELLSDDIRIFYRRLRKNRNEK